MGLHCWIIVGALLAHVAHARIEDQCEEAAVPEVTLEVDVEEIIAEEDEMMKPEGRMVEEAEDFILEDMDEVDEPGDMCIRYSPKEVFYTHLNPRLIRILDELSYFVESVLSRMESSLQTLLPHVDQSPIGRMRVEEVFPEVRRFVFGTMRDVYDEIVATWRELIHAQARGHATPSHTWRELIHAQARGHATPSHTLTLLAHIRETQQQGEQRLVVSLQELSITLKAVVVNSMKVIRSSLDLPSDAVHLSAARDTDHLSVASDTDHLSAARDTDYLSAASDTDHLSAASDTDHLSAARGTDHLSAASDTDHLSAASDTDHISAALALNNTISQAVPNFLGTLMSVILKRGSDPSGYKKVFMNPLRSATTFVDQMYTSLDTLTENGGWDQMMEGYWRSTIIAAKKYMAESPIRDENFEVIFENDEYLTELVLELMASF